MSDRSETFSIETTPTQERLDHYLRDRYPVVSRGTLQRLIEEGHIKVNGDKVKPTHRPRRGDQLEVYWPPARPSELKPVDMELQVLYEDDDLLVINKRAGVVVHPASGTETDTLVHGLLAHCRGSLSGIGGVERPGIVHRLDKETSGCLVVAKNDAAHNALTAQFKHRTIDKIYLAIVFERVVRESGEIQTRIARHPSHRKSMAVTTGPGRESRTGYRVVKRLRHATLVEVRLHTGRTHQIRVHFKHLGHPLVGDTVYGRKQVTRLEELTGFRPGRFLLHARTLRFDHPTTGKRLELEASVPDDFEEALVTLHDGDHPNPS